MTIGGGFTLAIEDSGNDLIGMQLCETANEIDSVLVGAKGSLAGTRTFLLDLGQQAGAPAQGQMDPILIARRPDTLGTTSSASERLWGAHDARALAPGGGEFEASRGLTAEAGYGLALFGDRFTGTPNLGLGLADGGARDYRIGWRLTSAVEGDPGFEVNLDAVRREAAIGNAPPEHGVMLRGAIRW